LRDFKDTLTAIREYVQTQGLGPAFFEFLKTDFDAFVPAVAPYVTAYCTPKLRGSFTPSEKYPYPVYQVPEDLVQIDTRAFKRWNPDLPEAGLLMGRVTADHRVEPYYTRGEIDFQGVLKKRNLEVLWVDNAADLYFLHVEGSGIIELENGSTTRVAYAGKNGQPCRLIGKFLREERILTEDQLSIPGIKKYLNEHPLEQPRIFSSDPSYVFFQPASGDYVAGCLNVPITANRSIATDRRLFPPGVPGLLEATVPVFDAEFNPVGEKTVRLLVFNQDTGGVIRGPGRVDWYVGSGPEAEALAGNTGHEGKLVLLVKKKREKAGGK
jgi:membrane-bound lytic murein transglycosylase A